MTLRVQDFCGGVTIDEMEVAREVELEVTELRIPHDKIFTEEELLFMDEQKKWFLEIVSS